MPLIPDTRPVSKRVERARVVEVGGRRPGKFVGVEQTRRRIVRRVEAERRPSARAFQVSFTA